MQGQKMSRSPISVTSDILRLKILIRDAVRSVSDRQELPRVRRESLSKVFHRYIRGDVESQRSRGISRTPDRSWQLPFGVMQEQAAGKGPALLSAIDRFVDGSLTADETSTLVDFLSRVDVALDRARRDIPVSRYL
jgi:hypothetical protein